MQVTIEYDGTRPAAVNTVVVSSQHIDDIDRDTLLAPDIEEFVIAPELADLELLTSDVRMLVNPTGRFVEGGPAADAGLTGRKIIVDTYGGMARHGGGAFSRQGPSKVDRSAAYAMRWVAKNVVAAGLATRCEVQVSYAIGTAHPVGLFVETFGTSVVPDAQLEDAILEVFDLRPAAIISDLDLKRPIYAADRGLWSLRPRGADFTWERTDRVEALQSAVDGVTDVARVAIESPLPHLDRLFDFSIPEELDEAAVPGCRVKVRFHGRQVGAWLIERGPSDFEGALQPLLKVAGPSVLTSEITGLARLVADRYAGSLSDVLRFAVPPRVAAVEKKEYEPAEGLPTAPQTDLWAQYSVSSKGASSWICHPHDDPFAMLAERAAETAAAGRGVVLVVPDARDVRRLHAACTQVLPSELLAVVSAEVSNRLRYKTHLEILAGIQDRGDRHPVSRLRAGPRPRADRRVGRR